MTRGSLSRRRALRLLGATLAGSTAGCPESDGTDASDGRRGSNVDSAEPSAGTAVVGTTLPPQSTPATANRADDRSTARGAPPSRTETASLAASDGDEGDWFGTVVALDRDTALVGAPEDEDPNGDAAGSAYVFARGPGGWRQRQKLAPDDCDPGDRFGSDVELLADTAFIGAPEDDDPNGETGGSVYVFDRDGEAWDQRTKLASEDGDAEDRFGACVTGEGETVLVGAYNDENGNGNYAGSVYVFERDGGTWTRRNKLVPDDGRAGERFGAGIAIEGTTAIVGAPYQDNDNGDSVGAAYAFERIGGTWTQESKLLPGDVGTNARFGFSIAIEGETALISARGDNSVDVDVTGTTHEYERVKGSWTRASTFGPSDADPKDLFGFSVEMEGSRAIVSASREEDSTGEAAGASYVYERTPGGWRAHSKLESSYRDSDDRFGWSTAVDEGTVLVGAPGEAVPNLSESGAAYVYDL